MKMFWIALLFLVAEGVLSMECPAQKDAEVLILGAGMAGITAARTLHDSGITNIKILEANSERIGGRIRNVSFMGVQVETAICLVPLAGDEAKRVSGLTKDEIYNEIMDVMRLWYGSDIPNATDIEYYDWYNDEFYRGMFSNIPLNLTLEEKENLAVPEGRLYFSGEGVMVYSTGTVHAAYCSGIDSATDILVKKGLSEGSSFLPKCEDEATMPPSQKPSPTPTTTAPPSSAYSVSNTSLISLIIALFFATLFAAFD
uniref:Amine oxidase domain-containing protein n=1 Tax=Amphimedon queenslandica TaxID=400682 RepID=A0A1X7TEP1_AMPQE